MNTTQHNQVKSPEDGSSQFWLPTQQDITLPDWPAPESVKAFSTLRTLGQNGGFSRPPYGGSRGGLGLNLALHVGDDEKAVMQNRALLRQCLKLPSEPVWLNQVHGAIVIDASAATGTPDADAAWTMAQGIVCVIMTADCLPVLLCTTDGKAVGAAHGGWRGLASGVLQNTVKALRTVSDAPIIAWLGPAIGPNAFEVGGEVCEAFNRWTPETPEKPHGEKVPRDAMARAIAKAFIPEKGVQGKYMADIYQIARVILADAGVAAVYGGTECTVADTGRYYSFRRDNGKTGRMATGIWLDDASGRITTKADGR